MYYINLVKEQMKISFMSAAIYRAHFLLMLLQSIINSVLGVLCVEFIYLHVDYVAGWSKNEMIILYCTSMIVNQLYRGLINPNHMRFLGSVSDGSFDRMLVKPVNIIFQINTGIVDYSSLLSLTAPVFILIIKLCSLDINLTGLNIILFLILVTNALLILASFMMLLYTLVFRHIKVYALAEIYYILMGVSERPKEIFSHKTVIYAFAFLIPAIPLANIPASVLLGKGGFTDVAYALVSGAVFSVISALAVKRGLRKYSSASS